MSTTDEVALQEWETATPDRWPVLDARRLAPRGPATRVAKALSRSGRLGVLELAQGLELRASSWVGRVTLDDLTVTIRPKIPQMPLLNLTRYAYGLRDLQLIGAAGFATERWSFQDLLIAQLIAEVSELVARGLHRDYRRTRAALESPRGRIDFAQYATAAGTARAALPCIHHPRTADTALNQALLAGLRLAVGATRDLELRARLRRLAAQIDLRLPPSGIDIASLARVSQGIDRRTSHYRPALTLIALLLRGESLSLAEKTVVTVRLDGFLFDMNAFFQALLSRFLREHLVNADILDEHRLRGVFFYDPRHNPQNRRGSVPRPDFVVRRGLRSLAIIDAKYRDLWARELPREMLYQLAVYALTQPNREPSATILYPTLSDAARDQVVAFQDVLGGATKARVILRPVHLLVLDRLLRAGTVVEAGRQRQAMASRLVGSEPHSVP
ncbi:MAG: hypothetical protein WAM94_19195 [Chromatiaceae bacterium]